MNTFAYQWGSEQNIECQASTAYKLQGENPYLFQAESKIWQKWKEVGTFISFGCRMVDE